MRIRITFACALAGAALATPGAQADPVPLAVYGTGTPGPAAGQLDSPLDVATDAAGNLYVADTENHRISVFSAEGPFLYAFGRDVIPGNESVLLEVCTTQTGCQIGNAGGEEGQLNGPIGIAADATGNLYVSDFNNRRISVFTSQGVFLRAFGFDVDPGGGMGFEVCTTSCIAGDAGGGAGQLLSPVGLAVDPAGHLSVVDRDNFRINVYTTTGAFLRAFGFDVVPAGPTGYEVCTTSCQQGDPGGAAGQLSQAWGVGIDATGNVLVADTSNHRISTYTAQGAFVRAIGNDVDPGGGIGLEVCTTICQASPGTNDAGGVALPADVVADPAANLHVADSFNARISSFTQQPSFLHGFGFDVVPDNAETGYEVCTTSCKLGVPGLGVGQLTAPTGIAADCRGAVYVAAGQRIQRFGEPGTALPPCNDPAPPPPAQKPSNEFSFGKLTRDTKKGTAKLTVIVPGPGELDLDGKQVTGAEKTAAGAGEVKLPVRAKGKARRKLVEKGSAKLSVAVTFTPTGGDPNTVSKRVKLKQR